MHLPIAAVVACASVVQAFKDTSPFLMLSNTASQASLKDLSQGRTHSSIDVLTAAKEFLSACESEKYYIISQPQLSTSGLSKSLPHLHEASTHESVQSRVALSEVVGLKEGDREELVRFVKEKCGAKVSQKFVENARYGEREVVTTEYDPMIGGWTESEKHMGSSDPALQSNVLKDIRKFYRYTFILLSTPSNEIDEKDDGPEYQADFFDPVHMDLKRDVYTRDKKSINQTNTRPLFEKYQFFTPGLFMGLLVGLILLSILSVGLRAIGSLEVSYAAFDKEMGPAAQKKQQ